MRQFLFVLLRAHNLGQVCEQLSNIGEMRTLIACQLRWPRLGTWFQAQVALGRIVEGAHLCRAVDLLHVGNHLVVLSIMQMSQLSLSLPIINLLFTKPITF